MSSASELEWKGYAIHDTSKWDEFKVIEFQPKPRGDFDVDVKIEFCGVCASDVHTISGGWASRTWSPTIVGHEIAGTAVWVGPKVTGVKVGDRVGVGAQVCACMDCKMCRSNNEQYCMKHVTFTYNSVYPECGTVSTGGYATAIRAHEGFVYPIPDDLPLEHAAPMFCGGLTVFSPLVRNDAGPGKRVGIVGIGGLGHFAIQFAKALGCEEVVVFSQSNRKQEDAMKLGASRFVESGKEGFELPIQSTLDLIICTADVTSETTLKALVSTLSPGGRFIMVALPEEKVPIPSYDLVIKGVSYGGSLLGSKKEVIEMLQLAVQHGVKPWIDIMPMKDCGKAVRAVREGKPRYRQVLKQDISP